MHIPFCRRKCNYCDFPSRPEAGSNIDVYLKALGQELAWQSEKLSQAKISSLFIGGGTPSLLSLNQLESLFMLLEKYLVLDPGAEVSVEANPGTLDEAKLQVLKGYGVNRLSLGVQSFDESLLQRLGRIHSAREVEDSYYLARKMGFDNINLDLMHGLPGQDLALWQETVNRALRLNPDHLALYGLIIEDGTPFGRECERGELLLPEEELRAEMAAWAAGRLAGYGYQHYEISNYALPGKQCRHNQVYWKNMPYLGFGAGAASYWQGIRRTNDPDIATYTRHLSCGKPPEAQLDIPSTADQMAETVFLGLRLLAGVSRDEFLTRFGVTLDSVYGRQINQLVNKGLLEERISGIRLSAKGLWLANEVFCEFIL